jgi:hypothetical protein
VKLFCGVLSAGGVPWDEVRAALEAALGPADTVSDAIPFDFTGYYRDETGPAIVRRFVSFRDLADPAALAGAKIRTNALEAELARRYDLGVPRPVNLDPGYLEQAKLVLASTKNFAHRIYLRDGIWAEITLHFRDGAWQEHPWTFPDYRSPAYQRYFLELRERYRRQLRPGTP